MYKKHLILGIGIGIFIASMIFFITFLVYQSSSINTPMAFEYEEDYIVERATDMGMIFFDKVNFQSSEDNVDENGNLVVSPDNYVYVTIPKDATAIEIAQIFEDADIIEDKAEFTNLIIDANLQRNLHHGDFLVPKDVTDEELLKMLTN